MQKMKRTAYWMLGLGAALWITTPAGAAIAPLSDDFTGAANSAPDGSKWTTGVAPNETVKVTQDGTTDLVVDVTAQPGNANHGVIRSVRNDFNFFQQSLTVEWKLDALTGTTTAAGDLNNSNRAYLMIVDDNNGVQTAVNATPGNAKTSIGLVVDRLTAADSTVTYVFRLEQTVNAQVGNNVLFLAGKTLSGTTLPSLITITFDHVTDGANPDKASIAVNLTGATFTDATSTLSDVSRELNATYNPGILTESAYNNFYLAAGGINNGNSQTGLGTTAKFDYINVVPEPTSIGLLGLAVLAMLHRR